MHQKQSNNVKTLHRNEKTKQMLYYNNNQLYKITHNCHNDKNYHEPQTFTQHIKINFLNTCYNMT